MLSGGQGFVERAMGEDSRIGRPMPSNSPTMILTGAPRSISTPILGATIAGAE